MGEFLTFLQVVLVCSSATAGEVFEVPKATIITDPSFRVRGNSGGESDGKTIGADGKPLTDHHIYMNDSCYFRERLNIGIETKLNGEDRARFNDLKKILTPKHPQLQKPTAEEKTAQAEALNSYAQRWSRRPDNDTFYSLARYMAYLEAGINRYQYCHGTLNYQEQLRVMDRIDLDKAPNPAGKELRDTMKRAITTVYKSRQILLRRYKDYYVIGQKQQEDESRKIVSSERFAWTTVPDTQLFIYQEFERTPMAKGLAWAKDGRTLMGAKPIFLPAKVRVQLIKTQKIDIPDEGVKGMPVAQIRVKCQGMRQHDGKSLSPMTLVGWTLAKQLRLETRKKPSR